MVKAIEIIHHKPPYTTISIPFMSKPSYGRTLKVPTPVAIFRRLNAFISRLLKSIQ